jgi:hypothetical protein
MEWSLSANQDQILTKKIEMLHEINNYFNFKTISQTKSFFLSVPNDAELLCVFNDKILNPMTNSHKFNASFNLFYYVLFWNATNWKLTLRVKLSKNLHISEMYQYSLTFTFTVFWLVIFLLSFLSYDGAECLEIAVVRNYHKHKHWTNLL